MIAAWFRRNFTRLGREVAFHEGYLKRYGMPYPGHVSPRPMPAPAPPISLEDRAARYQRGMSVRRFLGEPMLLQLAIDRDVLLAASGPNFDAFATWRDGLRPVEVVDPKPSISAHDRMFIVATEDIAKGTAIVLEAVSDGSFNATRRKL